MGAVISAHKVTSPTVEVEDIAERIDVSIVLPIFNEEGCIIEEITRIRAVMDASPYRYELVVVDDGSRDRSPEILAELADIQLITLPTNRGSGTARRIGTQASRGDVVVWTDVDMSYPNELIPVLVGELDGYDQIVGARTTEAGTHKFFRVPAKWFIRRLAGYLTETDIPDLNSGLRAFRRDVAVQYLHMLPAGFSCVTTITMTFLANGYSVRYRPIPYAERAGRSKFHWWKDTRRYITQVVRMVLTYNPLRVFIPLGGLLLLLAFGKIAFDVVDKDFRIATNSLVVLFAALQVVVLGLLADLIGRLSKPREQVEPAGAHVVRHPARQQV